MSAPARATSPDSRYTLHHGDNLPYLKKMQSASIPLIYIDPPFNTGKTQRLRRLKTQRVTDSARANGAVRARNGTRNGFGGHDYHAQMIGEMEYRDSFDDYLGFLRPRLVEAHRILTDDGSLFFHIDWRESAHCRLLLEEIFGGSEHCINEIIWSYDYGARSKKRWSTKHDNIYWFAKDPERYIFNYDGIDRIPYMAPGLVTREKAARGKTPTDVWWNTIVPTHGAERTGYPNQKPLKILERIILCHSRKNDTVLDFFAGSGSAGVAALRHNRRAILIDISDDAVTVMKKRFISL